MKKIIIKSSLFLGLFFFLLSCSDKATNTKDQTPDLKAKLIGIWTLDSQILYEEFSLSPDPSCSTCTNMKDTLWTGHKTAIPDSQGILMYFNDDNTFENEFKSDTFARGSWSISAETLLLFFMMVDTEYVSIDSPKSLFNMENIFMQALDSNNTIKAKLSIDENSALLTNIRTDSLSFLPESCGQCTVSQKNKLFDSYSWQKIR